MGPSACEDTLEEDAGKAKVEGIPLIRCEGGPGAERILGEVVSTQGFIGKRARTIWECQPTLGPDLGG